jgi:hypothetical protein
MLFPIEISALLGPGILLDYFPILHITADFFEHGMKFDRRCLDQKAILSRVSLFQFIQKVREFVFRLSRRYGNFSAEPVLGNLASIESVSPAIRLVGNASQIIGDGTHGISGFPEPDQLGMTGVSFGAALQNFLSQKTFPPERNQPLRIQISGVY